MAVEFHNAGDECAAFPHRILTSPAKEVRRFGKTTTVPTMKFVICAMCDHWVGVPGRSCPCEARCHQHTDIVAIQTEDGVNLLLQGPENGVTSERQDHGYSSHQAQPEQHLLH